MSVVQTLYKQLQIILTCCHQTVDFGHALDRSQSVFYFIPQERQTDTVTPREHGNLWENLIFTGKMDHYGHELTKTPKLMKQHVT